MDKPAIYSATLGLSHPWHITAISVSKGERRIDITIDFVNGSSFACPICGSTASACTVEKETWYHHDFFRFAAYLYASVPRIECTSCGITPVDRPWTNTGSKFVKTE